MTAKPITTATMNARQHFTELLAKLSPEAQRCDVGFYVRHVAGTCTIIFQEHRDATLAERHHWLAARMNQPRQGTTLATQFPADAQTIEQARP